MPRPRIIPILLLHSGKLVKTFQFRTPQYVGSPQNAIRIFTDRIADEIILLDISARARGSIDYRTLEQIVESAFVPMVYGGLIRNVEDAERILRTGFEKVSLNTNARSGIRPISERFGKQAVIASVDYHETERKDLPEILQTLEEEGAGEILLTDIDREGTYTGYDLETLSELRGLLSIPVIINGGASRVSDFKEALAHGADACAAGSMFVYHGGLKSVLINYPDRELLDDIANMQ